MRCEELVGGSWAAREGGGEVHEIFVEEFEGEGLLSGGVEFGGEGVRPGSAETVGAYGWFAGHFFGFVWLGLEELGFMCFRSSSGVRYKDLDVYLCVCVQVCLIWIVGLFSLPPSGSIDE